MASLYNGNVMKSIVTISSACALAFAGMASAQDAPAPAPAAETPAAPVAPAAEVSKEAKEAADQMLALMKEMSATLSTVKDKATADAAAEKMAKINEKGEQKQAVKAQQLGNPLPVDGKTSRGDGRAPHRAQVGVVVGCQQALQVAGKVFERTQIEVPKCNRLRML